MIKYDVVVVGAGPSGASAALKASMGNVDTLLIDKRREVGVPVQCGEYIASEDELKNIMPNSTHFKNLTELSRKFMTNRCKSLKIISPKGREYAIRFDAYVIDRSKFDKELVKQALRNGCDLWLESRAIKVDLLRNKLLVKRRREEKIVSFKVLILASGAYSRITKETGFKVTSLKDRSPTIQYVMKDVEIDQKCCEMYPGSYCPGGYAWIIPKNKGMANVGLGIRFGFSKSGKSIKEYLNRFITKHPVASKKLSKGRILSIIGGVVPVGGPIPKTINGNALVTGDAAGQVLAHVGGGVPIAVVCGEIAGEVASKHILEKTSLSEYEANWRKEVGEALNKSLKIRKVLDLIVSRDRLIETFLKMIDSNYMGEIIRCKIDRKFELIAKLANRFS